MIRPFALSIVCLALAPSVVFAQEAKPAAPAAPATAEAPTGPKIPTVHLSRATVLALKKCSISHPPQPLCPALRLSLQQTLRHLHPALSLYRL